MRGKNARAQSLELVVYIERAITQLNKRIYTTHDERVYIQEFWRITQNNGSARNDFVLAAAAVRRPWLIHIIHGYLDDFRFGVLFIYYVTLSEIFILKAFRFFFFISLPPLQLELIELYVHIPIYFNIWEYIKITQNHNTPAAHTLLRNETRRSYSECIFVCARIQESDWKLKEHFQLMGKIRMKNRGFLITFILISVTNMKIMKELRTSVRAPTHLNLVIKLYTLFP